MLTRDYNIAASDLHHQLPTSLEYGALLLHRAGNLNGTYHAVRSYKCRRCRNARLKSGIDLRDGQEYHEVRSTGYTCPSCGNPYAAKVAIKRYSATNAGKLH